MEKALQNADFSLPHIIISLCIIGAAIIIWQIFRHFYKKYSLQQEKETGSKPNTLFYNVARAVVVILVILAVLQINEVNVTSLVAGLGIASAVFGLALQDYLKDVIMGTHIVRDSFFKEGDIVRYGEVEGIVERFNMRTTKIKNIANGDILSVSNRNISEICLVPESQFQDIDIGLPYEEDPKKMYSILEGAVHAIGELDGVNSCELRGIISFEDSSVNYRIRFFCYPPDKFILRPRANRILYDHLRAAGISVPYPQLDIHTIKK